MSMFLKRKEISMKELKVGERVTLEVTETNKESCKGASLIVRSFAKYGNNILVASKNVQTTRCNL